MERAGLQIAMAYKRGGKLAAFDASFLPAQVMFHFTLLLVRIIDWLVFRVKIEGREHLQKVTSGLLVSNHTLVLDPGIIAHVIRPHRTYFTMLEETACIPLLGTFVRLLGAIPIPSTATAMRSLERAMRSDLRDLPFVHVFPEGECYLWNQQIEEFQLGAFYLACRLRLPVVPLTTVLHQRSWLGRGSFSLAGRRVRIPPQVTVVVGKPVYPIGSQGGSFKREAVGLSRRVRSLMQQTIDRQGGCKSMSKGRMPRLALQQM
ncbi:MAG: 1-acyl-sn-glycerol-3-phosphate acyltransferase [Spirochaetaceae bacterium]|nr:MAG: 1-acyl-sn-glycerol-3-phosphate acyltransferase [Spirochaetaceae bacterium]